MEPKIEKLMAQFALLFVGVWVFAAALGKGSQASLYSAKTPRNHPGGTNMYCGDNSNFAFLRPGYKNYQASVTDAQEASDTTATL